MKFRTATLVTALAALTLTGCEGLRDALTAHTDTAARAADQELSAAKLADLVGKSRAPLRRDVMRTVADIWVDYHLLAAAAARGDSLAEPAIVDSAMWSLIASSKARAYYDRVSQGWDRVDSASAPALYQSGELMAASHILMLTQGEPDSVKQAKLQRIRGLRARVTPANFAQVARENSEDRGSAAQGGSLGVFAKRDMVPEFERALLALQPGSISDVVETPFGYHIIYRPPYEAVRPQFLEATGRYAASRAQERFTTRLDSLGRIEIKGGAVAKARAAAADLDAHRSDRDALATSKHGTFTVGRLIRWIETFPPQQQLPQRIATSPDSMVEDLIRNFVRNDLILRSADSAGVRVSNEELQDIRRRFAQELQQAWIRLGIHPRMLADSARTVAERSALAARRVDDYLVAMIGDRAAYVPVAPPLQWALREKYDARVNGPGLDRALQLAARVRAQFDTTRAQQPPSVVPMPGAGAPPAPDTSR